MRADAVAFAVTPRAADAAAYAVMFDFASPPYASRCAINICCFMLMAPLDAF